MTIASAKFTAEAQVGEKEGIVRKWGKYMPVVTLLFPGGLFIIAAWLAVEFFRRGDDLAEDNCKGLAQKRERKDEGS